MKPVFQVLTNGKSFRLTPVQKGGWRQLEPRKESLRDYRKQVCLVE